MYIYNPEKRMIIVCGHYGAGKTNVAVNIALELKKIREKVTLIDIDAVNPFFRSADNVSLLEGNGVRCIIPAYANTNVDIPSIPPEIHSVFADDSTAVFDVGGDDVGSSVLAMFADKFDEIGYEMLYVINKYRPMIQSPEDALTLMREIESVSGLRCTCIVNNSNLGAETTRGIVEDSAEYAEEVSFLAKLPVIFTSAVMDIDCDFPLFKIKNVTKRLY